MLVFSAACCINSLSPDVKMHILLAVLHTFLMELVRGEFVQKTSHLILGDNFLYSHLLNV